MKTYKPIPKMDGGLLCNSCRRTIRNFKNEDEAIGKSGPVLCYKCLEELVYNYKTKNKEGFIHTEVLEILKLFPTTNKDKFFDALRGITCMMIGGEIVTYHCDIVTALNCGLENRNVTLSEWD